MNVQMLDIHDVVAANVAAIAAGSIIGADPDSLDCLYQEGQTGRCCAVGVALSADVLQDVVARGMNSDTVKDLAAYNIVSFASDVDEALIVMVQMLHDTCVNSREMCKPHKFSNSSGASALQILFSLPRETWADCLRDDLIPAVGAMIFDPAVSLWDGYTDFIAVFSEALRRLNVDGGRWHRVTDNHITSGGL